MINNSTKLVRLWFQASDIRLAKESAGTVFKHTSSVILTLLIQEFAHE